VERNRKAGQTPPRVIAPIEEEEEEEEGTAQHVSGGISPIIMSS